MKVMKFGGTSVGSVNSILSVKRIVESASAGEPVIVVVSALGGITDKLINTSKMAATGDSAYEGEFREIVYRHVEMIKEVVPAGEGLDDALLALHERTQAPIIATVGALGARVLLDKDTLLIVPGYPSSSVVDTIGAGDAHAGAVMLGLSRGMTLADAAALANRVCAKVVETREPRFRMKILPRWVFGRIDDENTF